MCLLPPNCLFCIHYHQDAEEDDWDCDAFNEIPDEIFIGGHQHLTAVANDQGIRFELDPDYQEEYDDVMDLRRQIRQIKD